MRTNKRRRQMPAKNKLKEFPEKKVVKAFEALKKGKMTVAQVAEKFDLHPTTVRYHKENGTYA